MDQFEKTAQMSDLYMRITSLVSNHILGRMSSVAPVTHWFSKKEPVIQ